VGASVIPGDLPARVSDWPEDWLYAVRERLGIMVEDPSRTPAEWRARAVEVVREQARKCASEATTEES
jgi:hypothetical protein